MEISLSAIIQSLVVAGIIWVGAKLTRIGERLVRIETVLTGPTGDNGIVSEVRSLREARHANANAIHAVRGELDVLVQRFEDHVEERAS